MQSPPPNFNQLPGFFRNDFHPQQQPFNKHTENIANFFSRNNHLIPKKQQEKHNGGAQKSRLQQDLETLYQSLTKKKPPTSPVPQKQPPPKAPEVPKHAEPESEEEDEFLDFFVKKGISD